MSMELAAIFLSMTAGISLAVALIHVASWIRRRDQRVHLALSAVAAFFSTLNVGEVLLIGARTPEAYFEIVRWMHIVAFALVVSLVVVVRLYFGAGRWWLAAIAIGLRLLELILNFYFYPDFSFREITVTEQIRIWGSESAYTAATGRNPWSLVSIASAMAPLLFGMDAWIDCWKREPTARRRRICVAGGGCLLALGSASVNAILVHNGLIQSTYFFGVFLPQIVGAISIGCGGDFIRAAVIDEQLQKTKFDLNRIEQRMRDDVTVAREQFREVFEAAPSGMIVVDRQDRITLVNARVEADFGYSRHELIGESIEILVPSRLRRFDADGSPNRYVEMLHLHRQATYREIFGLRKDGSEIPLCVDLKPIHGVGRIDTLISITDVSERRRSAELLLQEQEFLRQVLDINPGFIFAKDTEGRFTLANQSMAKLYGTTVDSLIGKTDADFNANADEVAWFRKLDKEVLTTLEQRFIPEERVTGADGSVHWLQTVKLPLRDKDGDFTQVLGTAIDITARKEAELDLAQQRNEVAHLSRVMMLSELSGSIAHELNQPLMAILSNAQAALRFMTRDNFDLDEIRDILRDIVNDDRRAGEVIRRLRMLLKKGEMQIEPINSDDLINSVQLLLRSDLLNGGIDLSIHCDTGLQAIDGDHVQLQQVLLNLMVNGCEAMANMAEGQRQLLVSASKYSNEWVCFCVSDKGHGIADDDLEHVFDSFFTKKPQGLGLGLAVCRRIISAHGGRIWASNNVDGGASFFFTVPISASLSRGGEHAYSDRESVFN